MFALGVDQGPRHSSGFKLVQDSLNSSDRAFTLAIGVCQAAVFAIAGSESVRPSPIGGFGPSEDLGVGHVANLATSFNGLALYSSSFPGALAPCQSRVVVVGQAAKVATSSSLHSLAHCSGFSDLLLQEPCAVSTLGVGQLFPNEPKSLPDVRSPDARSAQICRPNGVTRYFQVSLNKIEPIEPVLACNLLSKHDWRVALPDEMVEGRPEVPEISNPSAFACRAERLARTGACPNGAVIGPAGAAQGVGPDTDPGEEVTLCVPKEFLRNDVFDAAFVHHPMGDVPGSDQVAQPRCGVGVDLVVEGRHFRYLGPRQPSAARGKPTAQLGAAANIVSICFTASSGASCAISMTASS